MTILVSGGAGFIGSHVISRLIERGDSVIAIDNFDSYYLPSRQRQNLARWLSHPRFRFYDVDIRNRISLEQLFAKKRIAKVVHLAAKAGVRLSIADPALYEAVNIQGTLSLLHLAAQHEVENFVFASSSSVYGRQARVPFSEDDPAGEPVSPYAATKRAGELLCFTYHHLYRLPCTCLRYFTVYGPRGRPDMAPYLFVQAIFEGQELKMFGDGSSRRDYTYVDDIVDGTIAALDANLPFEIFNLGNSQTIALRDFIRLIERLTGCTACIRQMSMQPGDVPITSANIAKANRLLGYSPKVNIEEGIARFIDWYQAEVFQRSAVSRQFLPFAA